MEIISTSAAPSAIGPYSQAIKANGMIYISGCVGFNPETMVLVGNVSFGIHIWLCSCLQIHLDGLENQTRQTLTNMKNIVEAAGSSMSRVVKCTVLLRDMNDFAQVWERC